MDLTKSELNILEILLSEERPLSKSDILACASKNRPWKDSTIHIIINGLLEKGAIEEVGFVRTGKTYGRTFAPTKEGREYFSALFLEMARHVNVNYVFSKLITENAFSKEELDDLEKLIQRYK